MCSQQPQDADQHSSRSYFSTYLPTYLLTYLWFDTSEGFILNYFLYQNFDDSFLKLRKNLVKFTLEKKIPKISQFLYQKNDKIFSGKKKHLKFKLTSTCLLFFFLFLFFNGREWALWGLFCQAPTYCLAELAHQVHPSIHSFIHTLVHNWLGVIQSSVILAYKEQPRYIVNWYVILIWKNIPVWCRVWYQP
jgi:hypothetical protein